MAAGRFIAANMEPRALYERFDDEDGGRRICAIHRKHELRAQSISFICSHYFV
jgi:hypothetical protein